MYKQKQDLEWWYPCSYLKCQETAVTAPVLRIVSRTHQPFGIVTGTVPLPFCLDHSVEIGQVELFMQEHVVMAMVVKAVSAGMDPCTTTPDQVRLDFIPIQRAAFYGKVIYEESDWHELRRNDDWD